MQGMLPDCKYEHALVLWTVVHVLVQLSTAMLQLPSFWSGTGFGIHIFELSLLSIVTRVACPVGW